MINKGILPLIFVLCIIAIWVIVAFLSNRKVKRGIERKDTKLITELKKLKKGQLLIFEIEDKILVAGFIAQIKRNAFVVCPFNKPKFMYSALVYFKLVVSYRVINELKEQEGE